MTRTRVVAVATVATAVALTGAAATSASAHQRHHHPSVAGAWRNVVDPLPNPAGDPPPFSTRIAFAKGGVVSEAASSVPPGFTGASGGVGAWKQDGRSVTFTFEKYLFNAVGFAAIQRVQGVETLSKDGQTLSGTATATILAPDGQTVLRSFGVQASGTRMAP